MRRKWLAHSKGYQIRIALIGLVLLFLPWDGLLAQSVSALDFRKLLSYTKKRPDFSVLNELASQKKPPLYLIVVPPQQNEGAGTDGNEKPSVAGSSGSTHEVPQVLSIYQGKWDSSIPDATAIFVQNKSGDTQLMAALNRIVQNPPPELFDGDLMVLDSGDLEDLRRIVSINRDSPFNSKDWEQKTFLLTSIHSTQLTLVTGLRRGSHGMTIIHCFRNTVGPMPAIEVGPDKQEVVRELIEELRNGSIPIYVRINLKGVPDSLKPEELEAIYMRLSLNSERDEKTTRLDQKPQLDNKTGQVTFLAQVPREILREGSLSISLLSDRFMFVDTKSRRRVGKVPIDGWLSDDVKGTRQTPVNVAKLFDEKGIHDDFRSYMVPHEIVEGLDRRDCRELFDEVSEGRQWPQEAHVRCSALRYLDAVVQEIRIARELAAGKMEVTVTSYEPSSRWVSPARQRTRDAAIAIGSYLRNEVKASGEKGLTVEEKEVEEKELTVEEMIRVGPQSPSEGGIEIRLIE